MFRSGSSTLRLKIILTKLGLKMLWETVSRSIFLWSPLWNIKPAYSRAVDGIPTTILRLLTYLLVEIFQQAIKDLQEVLDRLLVPSDDIFACKHTAIVSVTISTQPSIHRKDPTSQNEETDDITWGTCDMQFSLFCFLTFYRLNNENRQLNLECKLIISRSTKTLPVPVMWERLIWR